MRRRTFALVGFALAVVSAALAALWVTQAPAIPPVAATGSDFLLAAPAPRLDPDAVEKLLKREIWGLPPTAYSRASQQQARAAEKPAPQWKLTGTYRVGPDAFVLVRQGDKTPEALKRGDTLPDGAKIVDIEEDRIWVLADGKRVLLEIRAK